MLSQRTRLSDPDDSSPAAVSSDASATVSAGVVTSHRCRSAPPDCEHALTSNEPSLGCCAEQLDKRSLPVVVGGNSSIYGRFPV